MSQDSTLLLGLRGVASIGPGFNNWQVLQAILRGDQAYSSAPTELTPSAALPPTERRRIGLSVKVALATAEQLFAGTDGADYTNTASIFTSSGGDGDNCHQLCTALTESPVMLSPTKFTNSVHNAPAGYFGIAHHAVQPSNSLCARDGSFALGLLEAAVYAISENAAVALIAYDVPYPEPLNSKRQIAAPMGIGLMLDRADHPGVIARLRIHALNASAHAPTTLSNAALEALRAGIPAARGLSLLACLQSSGQSVVLDAGDGDTLQIDVLP